MKLTLVLLGTLLLSACSGSGVSPQERSWKEYGYGVYWIPNEDFGNTLARFVSAEHCILATVTGDNEVPYGHNKGYWVVCR